MSAVISAEKDHWKPSLFIVGAAKCGTTAWTQYLTTNPQIQVGLAKEPNYFCTDLRLGRRMTLAQYRANFSSTDANTVRLDASVLYLFSDDAAQAISAFNPQARILIFLRDHVSFLRSYHNEMLFQGHENVTDLERAWELADMRRNGNALPPRCTDGRLVDYPRCVDFRQHIERFLSAFPENQVCVLWMPQWKQTPDLYFAALQRYIGMEPLARPEFAPIGRARKHRSRMLAYLINMRPPRPIMNIYYRVRERLGIHGRTRLMGRLKALNMRDAELPPVSGEFGALIERRCRADLAFVMAQAERSRRLLGLD
jgi:hypothetical protein